MAPLFDHESELHHLSYKGDEPVLKSLKHQHKTESELLALINLIETLERMGLM